MEGIPMISVVICTYNRSSSLAKTLESLRQMTVPSELKWELIVVDNNSTDNTRSIITEFARTSRLNVKYVFEPQQGLCYARNAGVANSNGEITAFTDDDVLVAAEWLTGLADTFTEFDCIAVGGKITQVWDGIIKPNWLSGPYLRLSNGPIPCFEHGDEAKLISLPLLGANMAFRKSAFQKYGLFRTDMDVGSLGPQLGGDFEFALRLLRAGESIAYSPRALVFHPAEQERITKAYFLRFYYNLGRAEIQLGLQGWPSGAVLYLGIPHWVFRALFKKFTTWLFALGAKRFFYKAQLYRLMGQMREAHTLSSLESHHAGSVIAYTHNRASSLRKTLDIQAIPMHRRRRLRS